jgi:hypothetical protein
MRAVADTQQARASERDARGLLPRAPDLIEDLSRVSAARPKCSSSATVTK